MFDVGAESTDTIRNLVTYDEDVTIFDKKKKKKENGTIVKMSEAVDSDLEEISVRRPGGDSPRCRSPSPWLEVLCRALSEILGYT